jgi:hypothetical protein
MAIQNSNTKSEPQKLLTTTIQKYIASHKEASAHLLKASEHHLQAVAHHEAGNPELASHSGVLAHEHFSLAEDAMIENLKLQAFDNK